jgi:hypothetical protein
VEDLKDIDKFGDGRILKEYQENYYGLTTGCTNHILFELF